MSKNVSDYFFFRHRELARLCTAMRSGRSIQLFGLRRIGKSYLLKRGQEVLETGERINVGTAEVAKNTLPPTDCL